MTRYQLNADGTFDVWDGHRTIFVKAFARATYHLADSSSFEARTNSLGAENVLSGASAQLALALHFEHEVAQLRVTNASAAPIFLDALAVLDCDVTQGGELSLDAAQDLFYLHHGWQSWSPTTVRRVSKVESVYAGDDYFEKHLPYGAPVSDERTSNAFMLLGRADDANALLLGFESGAHQFSQIRLQVAERVTRACALAFADGICLDAGQSYQSEPLVILFGDAKELYETYARRVARRMGRRGTRAALQGWCSWYYYYGENSLDDIRANMQALCAATLPLDVILIDDGYQAAIGDWTTIRPENFPDGMRALASEIRAAGKQPGLWLAPFGAQHNSALAHAHPEFLLRDAAGAPVYAWEHAGEKIYALDLTRPDVLHWLRELVRIVTQEWGYAVLKLDFIFAGALAGKPHDANVTRAEAYRRGLRTLVESAEKDAIIMGCGAPQLASVGLVDSMRVSQDVHFVWEAFDPANGGAVSTKHAVQNSLARAPFHSHWWLNDADCVLVRPHGDMNAMTRREMRTLATVAALTGGVLLDSDNVAMLKRGALADLRRVLPMSQEKTRVRKWFSETGAQPQELETCLADGRVILTALNWDAQPRRTVIALPDARAYHVYDFWNKKYLGVFRARVPIARHAAHEMIVLQCAPVSPNAGVIASNLHLVGAEVRQLAAARKLLHVELNSEVQSSGEILFQLPKGKRVKRARVNGRRARVKEYRRGVIGIPVKSSRPTEIEIEW